MKYVLTIRDPIHDYIDISSIEKEIIETPQFQRLRHIHHIGPAYFTYPSLHHTRFEHSIGVMHIAGKMIQSLLKESEQYITETHKQWKDNLLHSFKNNEDLIQLVRIVGLLHDLGHTAFSHSSEFGLTRFRLSTQESNKEVPLKLHEELTIYQAKKIIEKYKKEFNIFTQYKDELLYLLGDLGKEQNIKDKLDCINVVKSIISGQIDADRSDYLLRDGYMSGLEFGNFDLNRIIDYLTIINPEGKYNIAVLDKALSAVIRFVTERFFLYRWLYFHHGVSNMDEVISTVSEIIGYFYFEENNFDTEKIFSEKSPFYDDISFISFLRDNKTELINFAEENKEVDLLIGINNLELLINAIQRRENFPVGLWKRAGEYYDKFFNAISNGVREILQEEFSTRSRNLGDIYMYALFEEFIVETKGIPITNLKFLKKEIIDTLNEKGLLSNYKYNLLLIHRHFIPYKLDPSKEIYIIKSSKSRNKKGKYIRLSDISPLIRALYREWYQVPHWYIFIQSDNRDNVKRDLNKLRDAVKIATEEWVKKVTKEYIKTTNEEKIENNISLLQKKLKGG